MICSWNRELSYLPQIRNCHLKIKKHSAMQQKMVHRKENQHKETWNPLTPRGELRQYAVLLPQVVGVIRSHSETHWRKRCCMNRYSSHTALMSWPTLLAQRWTDDKPNAMPSLIEHWWGAKEEDEVNLKTNALMRIVALSPNFFASSLSMMNLLKFRMSLWPWVSCRTACAKCLVKREVVHEMCGDIFYAWTDERSTSRDELAQSMPCKEEEDVVNRHRNKRS